MAAIITPLFYQFQSTHPARGATMRLAPRLTEALFQSTHPARGATALGGNFVHQHMISIHAPREGCDLRTKTPILIH